MIDRFALLASLLVLLFSSCSDPITSCPDPINGGRILKSVSLDKDGVSEPVYADEVELNLNLHFEDGSKTTVVIVEPATTVGVNSFTITTGELTSNPISVEFEDWRVLGTWHRQTDMGTILSDITFLPGSYETRDDTGGIGSTREIDIGNPIGWEEYFFHNEDTFYINDVVPMRYYR